MNREKTIFHLTLIKNSRTKIKSYLHEVDYLTSDIQINSPHDEHRSSDPRSVKHCSDQ